MHIHMMQVCGIVKGQERHQCQHGEVFGSKQGYHRRDLVKEKRCTCGMYVCMYVCMVIIGRIASKRSDVVVAYMHVRMYVCMDITEGTP